MKTVSAAVILILVIFKGFSQSDISERQRLQELMEERRSKFESYMQSMQKRSGIFGGKTKKDLEAGNKVLMEIVETDNRIMGVLTRAIQFKTHEKASMNYDKRESDEQLKNVRAVNESLSKKIEALRAENEKLLSRSKKLSSSLFAAAVSFILMVLLYLRKKTPS
jgi:hypothetical protein